MADGMPPLKFRRTLEGEQLAPRPDRQAGGAPAAGVGAGLGTGAGAGQLPSPAAIQWQGNPAQPWTMRAVSPSSSAPMDPMMALVMMLMNQQNQQQQARSAAAPEHSESEQVKLLRHQLEEERSERKEEQRRREFEQHIAQQNAKMDQLAAIMQQQHAAAAAAGEKSKDDKRMELITGLAPLIAPIVQSMLSKGDAMSAVFSKLLETQQASANQNMGVMTTLMNRPGAEDRIDKMVGTFSNLMSTQLTGMSSLLQSGLLDKGGDSPAVQIVSQLLDTVGGVAKVALAAKMGMSPDEDDEPMSWEKKDEGQPTPPERQLVAAAAEPVQAPVATDGNLAGISSGVSAGVVEEAEVVEPPVGDVESDEAEAIADFMADTAFQKIIELVITGGDVKEIALRMWRHAGSGDPNAGHPVAKAWISDPVQVGQYVLSQIRSEQFPDGIPDMRIVAVTQGIDAFKAFLRNGGEAEHYVPLRPKRRRGSRFLGPLSAVAPVGELDDSDEHSGLGDPTTAPVEPVAPPPAV